MTKSNIGDAYRIPKWMLSTTGAWPRTHASVWYDIKGTVNFILAFILGITMVMETVKDLNDFMKLSEILYIMISVVVYLIKHISFYFRSESFSSMIEYLNHPIFASYPDKYDIHLSRNIKISQRISNTYRTLVFLQIVAWSVSPIIDGRTFPFPFSYDLGGFNYVFYIFQIVSISIAAFNNSCLDYLTASLMSVAASELEILSEKIIETGKDSLPIVDRFSEDADNRVVETIKQCVEHHLAIMTHIDYIESIFSFGILVQFLGSATVLCNTLFHSVLVPIGSPQFIVLAVYMTVMLLQLFIYCWFGNDVALKSISVAEACYFFKWYNYGDKVRKYLFIIMERSKRPLVVTAFGFSPLSLQSFTTIMRWSYSYFALLMKMYSKESKTTSVLSEK